MVLEKTKTATTLITFFRAHKRAITFSLVAFCAFWLSRGALHRPYFLPYFALFVMLIFSQLFWIGLVVNFWERFIPGKPRRIWLAVIATVVWVFFFRAYNFDTSPADPRLHRMLIDGAFSVWVVGSWLGFGLVMVFWAVKQGARGATWVYRYIRRSAADHATIPEPDALAPSSPVRRHLLWQVAIAVSATPFAAAAYGLLYGRLDVEITHRRIALARLPKAFDGFRIAQLSDIHISPFMTAAEIRRCVTLTNEQKPDLIVMTGDYLSWDTAWQGEVVQALAGLRAPYGVFGSLGNHESITQTEESITGLFAAQGIHILRQKRAPIQLNGETINLIGVDDSQSDDSWIDHLVIPDTVNILLTHVPVPDTLDWAVKYGF